MSEHASRLTILAHVLAAAGLASEALLLAVAIPRHDGLISFSPEIMTFTVSSLVVGWVLAWKRPRIAVGWIVLTIALLTAAQGPTAAIGIATLHPGTGVAAWMLWYGGQSQWSWVLPIGLLITQLPLRFPDGQLPSRRWRWFSWYTMGALGTAAALFATTGGEVAPSVPNPTFVSWEQGPSSLAVMVALLLLGTSCVGSLASLLVRYRSAGETERTQLRWIFWAVAIVVGVLVAGWIENLLFGDDRAPGVGGFVARASDLISTLTFSLIPLAILFAVLRTNLYAIDRIISRTALYAIVTVSAVVIYGAVVLVLSQLLPGLPSIGVAVATLTAAGAFLPLLHGTRRVVDRRFDRAQYDAEKVATAFGERVRTGADPHTAALDLVGAVERTLQPVAVGLWLNDLGRGSNAASGEVGVLFDSERIANIGGQP